MEGNLTLQKVLDIAQSMERAVENTATLRGKDSHHAIAVSGFSQGNDVCTNPSLDQVHMLKSKHNSKGQREPLNPCFECAKTGHSPALCKFKNSKCHHCGKLGHTRPSCKSREKTHHKNLEMFGMYRKNRLRVIESIASFLSLLMVRPNPIQLC